jgi:hypothetical protein
MDCDIRQIALDFVRLIHTNMFTALRLLRVLFEPVKIVSFLVLFIEEVTTSIDMQMNLHHLRNFFYQQSHYCQG